MFIVVLVVHAGADLGFEKGGGAVANLGDFLKNLGQKVVRPLRAPSLWIRA